MIAPAPFLLGSGRLVAERGARAAVAGARAAAATALALLIGPAPCAPQADDALVVLDVELAPARIGTAPVRVTVRNAGDTAVLAVLDVRAEPGLWLIPNVQRQFARHLGPGEAGVLEGTYEFVRLSREGTVRLTLGPGEAVEYEGGTYHRLTRVDWRQSYDVGVGRPSAFDPAEHFATLRRGPLTLYAWRGSRAHERLDALADERLEAMRALARMLVVDPPDSVRLVFYADEATKVAQTGHRGVGWAFGRTLVEVLNDSVRIDPYHELAHVVAAAAGSPPALLDEGFAVFASERLGADALDFLGHPGRSTHGVACAAAVDGRAIPLMELLALDGIGTREGRTALEYALAGSFVRHLVEAHGMDRFREAYAALEAGGPTDENAGRLTRIYGRPPPTLEREWLAAACGR